MNVEESIKPFVDHMDGGGKLTHTDERGVTYTASKALTRSYVVEGIDGQGGATSSAAPSLGYLLVLLEQWGPLAEWEMTQ